MRWMSLLTRFQRAKWSLRVSEYFDLRSEREKKLPPMTVTDDVSEIRRAIRALAKEIRPARDGAKQGDIFTPTISVEFRRVLFVEMDANTWEAIMDDNPGELSNHINGNCPEGKRSLRCHLMPWQCCRGFLRISSIVSWDVTSSCSTREQV